MLLATKFGGMAMVSGGSEWGKREAIVECVEASLRRLRTDRIDLYQIHYPDPKTPVAETLAALNDLIQAGKVRAVGTPLRFSKTRAAIRARAPELGEHTEEILESAGYSPEEIAKLREKQVIPG